MTDSIQITGGVKRILINGGPAFIEFNPSDVGFAERFYKLVKDFRNSEAEYTSRATALDKETEKDEHGIPVNLSERLKLIREFFGYIRDEIDRIFGPETSQKAFGEYIDPEMLAEFFNGIGPFIKVAREEKIAKFTPPPPVIRKNRKKHAVMK